MVTVVDETQTVSVPGWVTDINAFRRWLDETDLPEHARAWWLEGEVWVDMSGTACKVPSAPDYIRKVQERGAIGKKRKTVKC